MKNKGFTLVELLAVIIILGVLLSIAVPSVVIYLNKADKNYYKTLENSVKAAAMKYFNDNLIGTSNEIKIICKSSIAPAYIEKITTDDGKECQAYVSFNRTGTNKYKFTPYVKCNGYKTSEFNDDIICPADSNIGTLEE